MCAGSRRRRFAARAFLWADRGALKDPGAGDHRQEWRTRRKGSVRKLVRNPEAFAGCADADATEPGRYRQSLDRSVKCGFPG